MNAGTTPALQQQLAPRHFVLPKPYANSSKTKTITRDDAGMPSAFLLLEDPRQSSKRLFLRTTVDLQVRHAATATATAASTQGAPQVRKPLPRIRRPC